MGGSQGDYQCTTCHARNVGDVVESRRRQITGIGVLVDAMTLRAVGLGEPTALSDVADLLRV